MHTVHAYPEVAKRRERETDSDRDTNKEQRRTNVIKKGGAWIRTHVFAHSARRKKGKPRLLTTTDAR